MNRDGIKQGADNTELSFSPDLESYPEQFIRFSKGVEGLIRKSLILLVLLLAISQLLLIWRPVRLMIIPTERLEGKPYRQGAVPESFQNFYRMEER